jgi:hypothetical protein
VSVGPSAASALGVDAIAGGTSVTSIEIELPFGHNLRGSLKHLGEAVAFIPVYFFDEDGTFVGQAITDGLGEFVSESGLPDGTYFAATSRAATTYDTPEEAANAEDGVGQGLQDQAWSGFPCNSICAPSQGSGFGTPITISGADATGINIVLGQASGIRLEKLTNGVDADTPNRGDAPQIAAGDTVIWTYRLTNTGGDALEQIAVEDQGLTVTCPKSTLAPAEVMDCSASAVAVNLDNEPFTGVIGNCGGEPNSRLYQNVAIVTAKTAGAVQVEDDAASHYCNPLPLPEVIFKHSFE